MTPPLPTDVIWATRAEMVGIDAFDVLLLVAVVYALVDWLLRRLPIGRGRVEL